MIRLASDFQGKRLAKLALSTNSIASASRWIFVLSVTLVSWMAGSGCGPDGPHPGKEAFTSGFCTQCHGEDRAGTPLGPPIQGLRDHWTEATLLEYLEDPAKYIQKEPRLEALTETYPMIMPKFTMDESTRIQLVRYLLSTDE